MADAMVTTRMTEEKKAAGARAFKRMGTSASRAINDFYDFVIAHGSLPFEKESKTHDFTQEQLDEAITFVREMPAMKDSRFANMSKDEARRERLIAKGLMDPEDF